VTADGKRDGVCPASERLVAFARSLRGTDIVYETLVRDGLTPTEVLNAILFALVAHCISTPDPMRRLEILAGALGANTRAALDHENLGAALRASAARLTEAPFPRPHRTGEKPS
jgi:hypothetical protein